MIVYRLYDDSSGETHAYYENEYDAEDARDMIREDRCSDDWQVEPIEVVEEVPR